MVQLGEVIYGRLAPAVEAELIAKGWERHASGLIVPAGTELTAEQARIVGESYGKYQEASLAWGAEPSNNPFDISRGEYDINISSYQGQDYAFKTPQQKAYFEQLKTDEQRQQFLNNPVIPTPQVETQIKISSQPSTQQVGYESPLIRNPLTGQYSGGYSTTDPMAIFKGGVRVGGRQQKRTNIETLNTISSFQKPTIKEMATTIITSDKPIQTLINTSKSLLFGKSKTEEQKRIEREKEIQDKFGSGGRLIDLDTYGGTDLFGNYTSTKLEGEIPSGTSTTYTPFYKLYTTEELQEQSGGTEYITQRIKEDIQKQREEADKFYVKQIEKDFQEGDALNYQDYESGKITYEEYVKKSDLLQEELNIKLENTRTLADAEFERRARERIREETFFSGVSAGTFHTLGITPQMIKTTGNYLVESGIVGSPLINLLPEKQQQATKIVMTGATIAILRKAPSLALTAGTAFVGGYALGTIGTFGRVGGITADIIAGSSIANVATEGYGLAKKGAKEFATRDLIGLGETIGETGTIIAGGLGFAKGFKTGIGKKRYYGVTDYLFTKEKVKGTDTGIKPSFMPQGIAREVLFKFEGKEYPLKQIKGEIIYPEREVMVQSRAGKVFQFLTQESFELGKTEKKIISPKREYQVSGYYDLSQDMTYGIGGFKRRGAGILTYVSQVSKPSYNVAEILKSKKLSATEKELLKDYLKSTNQKTITLQELEEKGIKYSKSISMKLARGYLKEPKQNLIWKTGLGLRQESINQGTNILIFPKEVITKSLRKGLTLSETKQTDVIIKQKTKEELNLLFNKNIPVTLFFTKSTAMLKDLTPKAKSSMGIIYDLSSETKPTTFGEKVTTIKIPKETPEINQLALKRLQEQKIAENKAYKLLSQIQTQIPSSRAKTIQTTKPSSFVGKLEESNILRTPSQTQEKVSVVEIEAQRTKLESKPSIREETKSIVSQITRTGERGEERYKGEVGTLFIQTPIETYKEKSLEGEIFGLKQQQKQRQQQKQQQKLKIQYGFQTPSFDFGLRERLKLPPSKIKAPPVKEPEEEPAGKERGFLTFVKFGKGYKQLGKPTTKSKAIAYGALQTDVTLARSFKVVPTKKFVKKEKPFETDLYKFRTFQQKRGKRSPLENTFIEKSKYALERGEQRIIRPLSVTALKAKARERRVKLF